MSRSHDADYLALLDLLDSKLETAMGDPRPAEVKGFSENQSGTSGALVPLVVKNYESCILFLEMVVYLYHEKQKEIQSSSCKY